MNIINKFNRDIPPVDEENYYLLKLRIIEDRDDFQHIKIFTHNMYFKKYELQILKNYAKEWIVEHLIKETLYNLYMYDNYIDDDLKGILNDYNLPDKVKIYELINSMSMRNFLNRWMPDTWCDIPLYLYNIHHIVNGKDTDLGYNEIQKNI
jgi:hypothetical protein